MTVEECLFFDNNTNKPIFTKHRCNAAINMKRNIQQPTEYIKTFITGEFDLHGKYLRHVNRDLLSHSAFIYFQQ